MVTVERVASYRIAGFRCPRHGRTCEASVAWQWHQQDDNEPSSQMKELLRLPFCRQSALVTESRSWAPRIQKQVACDVDCNPRPDRLKVSYLAIIEMTGTCYYNHTEISNREISLRKCMFGDLLTSRYSITLTRIIVKGSELTGAADRTRPRHQWLISLWLHEKNSLAQRRQNQYFRFFRPRWHPYGWPAQSIRWS